MSWVGYDEFGNERDLNFKGLNKQTCFSKAIKDKTESLRLQDGRKREFIV